MAMKPSVSAPQCGFKRDRTLSRLLYVLFRDPASFSDCTLTISLGFDGWGYLGVANDGSWSTIARAEAIKKGQRVSLPLTMLRVRASATYFAYTKCPRRFCCQQDSFDSVQNGFSLP